MKALRALTAVLALIALPRSPAWACSCVTAPAQTYLARASAAFTGEARLVQPQGGGVVVATFRVERVYKGSVGEEVSVFTGAGVDACGIAFTEKRAYTVFASTKAGALVTGLCDGTAEGDTLAGSKVIRDYSTPVAIEPAPARSLSPIAVAAPLPKPASPQRSLPITAAAFLACAVTVAFLRRSSAA